VSRLDALNTATLNALAFNDPQKLTIERDAALGAAKYTPETRAADDAAWRAAADRLLAAVEHGGLLDDTPTESLTNA
jgi:hypothetical protein